MALSVEPPDPGGAPERSGPSGLGDESFNIADHFTEAEIMALCDMDSAVEAVLAVVSRFSPVFRHWNRSAHEGQGYVVFAQGDDRWAKVRFTRSDTSRWTVKETWRPHEFVLGVRRALLEHVLGQVKRYDHLTRRIAKPFTPLPADSGPKQADRELARASLIEEYNGAVGLWWDIRLSEGFTSDAARMLLGLTVPIETLQRLVFPADASPYVLYNGSCPFTPPASSS